MPRSACPSSVRWQGSYGYGRGIMPLRERISLARGDLAWDASVGSDHGSDEAERAVDGLDGRSGSEPDISRSSLGRRQSAAPRSAARARGADARVDGGVNDEWVLSDGVVLCEESHGRLAGPAVTLGKGMLMWPLDSTT